MKKKIFKAVILCISLICIIGIINLKSDTDQPGPIGVNDRNIHCS